MLGECGEEELPLDWSQEWLLGGSKEWKAGGCGRGCGRVGSFSGECAAGTQTLRHV